MAAEPALPSSASVPRRATGEIPLSWAVPAEAVTAGPPSHRPVSLMTVFGALVVVAAVGFAIVRWMSPPAVETDFLDRAVVVKTPPSTPPAVDAVVGLPPPPPPSVQTVAVAEAPALASEPNDQATDGGVAARTKARQLVARARRSAKGGDIPEARALAEAAVAADPACGGYWKTLALLRRKTGDRAGATAARARADALVDDGPL